MLLLYIFETNKLKYVTLFLVFAFIVNAKPIANGTLNIPEADKQHQMVEPQKTVKKELKVNFSSEGVLPEKKKDDHVKKILAVEDKTIMKTITRDSEENLFSSTDKKQTTTIPQHNKYNANEEFVLTDRDEVSESLQIGFYFFLMLSAAAIVFIVFKIYRLRLSRAERKYGVHGDRSTQELTPLPTSIEDGHSDEEDQTLFEIQRQNIRIL